jgi:formylmethanofuran dehydrogenase subunit E
MPAEVEQLLLECAAAHGHLCPGQVLGVRLSLLGCELLGIKEPKGADRKKLIVFVETDRCMADAVGVVTGVRLGRRSLKFYDYGKAAATFLHLEEGRAVRLAILESARAYADEAFGQIAGKKERQMAAYKAARPADLFKVEWVKVELEEADLPGSPRSREICRNCCEGVNDLRFVREPDGGVLCRPCSLGSAYYRRDD